MPDIQRQQVDINYDAFQRSLQSIIRDHRDQYALMRDRVIVDYFDNPGAAYDAGMARFSDGIFSIQEVTDEPIELGFWSVAAD
ncbi:hypothetical protein OKW76_10370 [Sphingomonas sp. S1-29]|uniref:hypothetical protein n=1 Tax=Sphingomonas sp. S1-29 TaxID=2991074 RepID=UPI00223EA28A|nr:hypothetical protein [Sphingomonas sp. S1-29]UZK68465.1 hypothetical protein OKW76_10370 [Sphingomonas sp. S1-29]